MPTFVHIPRSLLSFTPRLSFFFSLSNFYKIPNEPFEAFEKMDGCCSEETEIITDSGVMTIKQICDSNFSGNVLSYNIHENVFEFKPILSTSVQRNNNDWYELELENGDIIRLTGNHKVWLPELNCYRRVDKLNGNECFLLYE